MDSLKLIFLEISQKKNTSGSITFDVEVTVDRHNVNLLIGRCRKMHRLTAKSLDAASVKFPQNAHNSRFLSGATRAKEHQMWEILLLTQSLQVVGLLDMVI